MEVTERDLHHIFFHAKDVDYKNAVQLVEEKLGCRLDDSMRQTVHLSLKNFKRNKEKWFTKKRKTLNYDEYDKKQSDRKNEILMQVEVDNSPPR